MEYLLTARLGDEVESVTIDAADDGGASLDALPIIMDNAHDDQTGPWALGEITLIGPNGLVNRMEAK